MTNLVVRRATDDDMSAVVALLDGFAVGHPAQGLARSPDRLRQAFFDSGAIGYVLIAEQKGAPIGLGIWRKTYDVFWSMFGGEGIALYVRPEKRGFGVAASIVAAMCADIRREGGEYLLAYYAAERAAFYERVGLGGPERSCHVSATAFRTLADLAGKSPREIVRGLPDKSFNSA
jgi:GNAT superfamily N-acetyltransferase